ncbi:MAG TPA: AAA family ATPase [Ktedonobacterales bacterium]
MRSGADDEFAARLHRLARPEAFPFPVLAGQPVEVIQTHASAVLLAGDRAYKLKKPQDFGFFDYSTVELRRHFCREEVRLNARLAPDVYLGVAPVLATENETPRFGSTLAPEDELPLPGSTFEGRHVVDYAVVMRRLPEEATLAARVAAGTATPAMLADVARIMARFHAAGQTDAHIAHFGTLDVIAANWEENFAQMRPYIGRTLSAQTFERIANYVHAFLAQRASLFAHRVSNGRIRDCHGDLRLQHVYLLDDAVPPTEPSASRIAIVDCIEFNERFRYSDVGAELAFPTMELDLAGRPDLARAFVDAYVAASDDAELRELLPFYACYRACVRGKVLAFQLDETEVPEPQREEARRQAQAHFDLAAFYASAPAHPTLLLIGGLMGTGKSTLATALHAELGWPIFSSDAVRKRLAQREASEVDASAFGEGIYRPVWTARTYSALRAEAEGVLAMGCSVILDATFARREDRDAAAQLAARYGARIWFVECVSSPSVVLERLQRRWMDRLAGQMSSGEHSSASDGRPELYAAQRAAWEPFDAAREHPLGHLITSTDQPLPASASAALDALEAPRLVCWL